MLQISTLATDLMSYFADCLMIDEFAFEEYAFAELDESYQGPTTFFPDDDDDDDVPNQVHNLNTFEDDYLP